MSDKPETARVIAEALHAWMDALPARGWVHGQDFLPANVVCDHHGKSKFIEGMATIISVYLTSALEERERPLKPIVEAAYQFGCLPGADVVSFVVKHLHRFYDEAVAAREDRNVSQNLLEQMAKSRDKWKAIALDHDTIAMERNTLKEQLAEAVRLLEEHVAPSFESAKRKEAFLDRVKGSTEYRQPGYAQLVAEQKAIQEDLQALQPDARQCLNRMAYHARKAADELEFGKDIKKVMAQIDLSQEAQEMALALISHACDSAGGDEHAEDCICHSCLEDRYTGPGKSALREVPPTGDYHPTGEPPRQGPEPRTGTVDDRPPGQKEGGAS